MEFIGYNPHRSFPVTPPYIYPYDYKFCTLPKSEERIHFVQDVYPQFPTPPLPSTPPAAQYKEYSHSPAERTISVIMRVTDHKITEVKTSRKEEFTCHWLNCWRIFESLESLAAHVTQIHAVASVGGLYYCKWEGCPRMDRGFNARYKMLVHVRTHTKEKPHQCQLCDKSFSRAENLKIHTRSHSGEKPYVCPFEGCNKAYSNSSDRFKHTRTHSTEKPYVCKVPGCQKRYTDPSSLRKHVKTFKHTTILEENNTTRPENIIPLEKSVTNCVDYHRITRSPTDGDSPKSYEDTLFPQVKCHCSHGCFDHYRSAEMYKIGNYFNGMFMTCDQSVDPITSQYWVEPHLTIPPENSNVPRNISTMDVDMPLDLSIHRDDGGDDS